MELMNTIAVIERYAASEGDVGMFITITSPSKYHPTRQVTRSADWRIVPKVLAVEPLTSKAALPRLGVLSITVESSPAVAIQL